MPFFLLALAREGAESAEPGISLAVRDEPTVLGIRRACFPPFGPSIRALAALSPAFRPRSSSPFRLPIRSICPLVRAVSRPRLSLVLSRFHSDHTDAHPFNPFPYFLENSFLSPYISRPAAVPMSFLSLSFLLLDSYDPDLFPLQIAPCPPAADPPPLPPAAALLLYSGLIPTQR